MTDGPGVASGRADPATTDQTLGRPSLGIAPDEWQRRVDAAIRFLEPHAQLGRQTPVTYSEVNYSVARDCGLPEFDFGTQLGRKQIGHLLGQVSRRTRKTRGVLLSAIVGYKDPTPHQSELGQGFFNLAESLGLLRRYSSGQEREAFWVKEMQCVFKVYGADRKRPPRQPRT